MARAPAKRPRKAAKKAAAAPWSKKKAAERVLAPSSDWADRVRERVLADCHPFQRAAAASEARFISLLVGRGGGKTTTMRARAIIALTRKRKARMVYIAPTREMAIELQWIPLKESIEFYGLLDDFVFNETRLTCRCTRTGAVYKLVGLDDKGEVNKLRGRPFDEVHVDEASLYPALLLEDLLDRAIGPRLGERRGTIVMGGTPGHILAGPFYDNTRPGSTVLHFDEDDNEIQVPLHVPWTDVDGYPGWDSWVSYHWTLKSVAELPGAIDLFPALVNLWAEALKVKKRKRWSDENPIWLREYLGIWAADDTGMVFRYRAHKDGLPWNQWDPFGTQRVEGIQQIQLAIAALRAMGLKDLHFIYSADNGHKDPFALNVFAFSPTDIELRIYHVLCIERVGMYAGTIADLLIGPKHDTEKPEGVLKETDWPDAAVMDSDHGTIVELANTYGFRFKKAERAADYKMGAIELVNGDLVDGRIKVLKGTRLEQQMMSLQWAEDQFGHIKENKAQANHCTDCAIYARKEASILFDRGIVSTPSAPGEGGAPVAAAELGDNLRVGSRATDPTPQDVLESYDQGEFGDLLSSTEFDDSWG